MTSYDRVGQVNATGVCTAVVPSRLCPRNVATATPKRFARCALMFSRARPALCVDFSEHDSAMVNDPRLFTPALSPDAVPGLLAAVSDEIVSGAGVGGGGDGGDGGSGCVGCVGGAATTLPSQSAVVSGGWSSPPVPLFHQGPVPMPRRQSSAFVPPSPTAPSFGSESARSAPSIKAATSASPSPRPVTRALTLARVEPEARAVPGATSVYHFPLLLLTLLATSASSCIVFC